ncbi:uncharacterized protein LOC144344643, partial [Saccoglossus kowalevskii]
LGIIGLVEEEWLVTLATIDRCDLTYLDFVTHGRRLAKELKQQGADYVIALTHMRWPNDIRLAENVREIDLILGGHDHDYDVRKVNGKLIVKSGTDFRTLTRVTIEFALDGISVCTEKINVTADIAEDKEVKDIVEEFHEIVAREMEGTLGYIEVDLDGRFSMVRTGETNLGNFITDIMLSATAAEIALLNSGTLRSDRIHPKGEFCKRDLMEILPMVDQLVVLEVTGVQLLEALENGVCQFPKFEGRFPQVAGIRFAFNPDANPMNRVDPYTVIIDGEHLLPNKVYKVCTKLYIAQGKDAYEVFKRCRRIVNEDGPILSTIVQNYFNSVQMVRGLKPCRSGHRQNIIGLVRKASLSNTNCLRDLESEMSKLAPQKEGRIVILDEDERKGLQERRNVFYEAATEGDILLQKEHGKGRLAAHLVPAVSITEATISSDEADEKERAEIESLLGLPLPDNSDANFDNNKQTKAYYEKNSDFRRGMLSVEKYETDDKHEKKVNLQRTEPPRSKHGDCHNSDEYALVDNELDGDTHDSMNHNDLSTSMNEIDDDLTMEELMMLNHVHSDFLSEDSTSIAFTNNNDDEVKSLDKRVYGEKSDCLRIDNNIERPGSSESCDSVFTNELESFNTESDSDNTKESKKMTHSRRKGGVSEELRKMSESTLIQAIQKDNLQEVARVYLNTTSLESGKPLLHAAIENNAVSVTQYFLKDRNMDPDTQDNTNQRSPLMVAAERGSLQIAKLLIEYGANIDIQDHDGNTALHTACNNEKEDIKQLFLQYGADVNIANNNGEKPTV